MRAEKNIKSKMKYVHVTFDHVGKFVPRVPKQRAPGEDKSIARICVAPSIRQACKALPQFGQVVDFMKKTGLPAIIHVYYLESDHIMDNEKVAHYVPDAIATGEMWILDIPQSVKRIDYEITEFSGALTQDHIGHEIFEVKSMKLKRCKFQSNKLNLIYRLSENKRESSAAIFDKYSYRTVISNLEKYVRTGK